MKCQGVVAGSRPWWMGEDQWDGPCNCALDENHEGFCQCRHMIEDND